MLLSTEQLQTILDLIIANQHQKAVKHWQLAKIETQNCNTCFYKPLEKAVRCSACLEGHLTSAVMSFAYPEVSQTLLENAERSLKSWLKVSET